MSSSLLANTVLAGSTLAENALGPVAAYLTAGTGANRTRPASTPVSLYSLCLRFSQPPFFPLFVYTFPLSPQSITREVMGMGNYYDVGGSASNFGVNRIIDVYGQSPPVYRIGGTTGVKFHSRDGFLWSGLQSIQILQGMIAQYFSFNAAVAQQGGANLYRLEFYDFYNMEFWEVVPLGPQGIIQNSARPQLQFYQFTFVGLTSLEQPIAQLLDPLLSDLATNVGNAFTSVGNSITNFLSSYTSSSPS